MGLQVVVVTGLSGAGRSTALRVLEDLGYYCVDNLPPALASDLATLAEKGGQTKLGLGIDVRSSIFAEGTEVAFDELTREGHAVEVLFLDCGDNILVRRYSETRRPHPLAPDGDVLTGIGLERERLAALRERATRLIDTSRLSVHDLRRALVDWLSHEAEAKRSMVVRVTSFGFKYGVPVDADLVFDLRYLPNPHFVPELKPQTGLDEPVATYVLENPETKELMADLEQLLGHTLPRYEREGKAYLTIAIGCTGGRHRSVAVTEALAKRLPADDVRVAHRDVNRKKPK